MKKGFKKFLGAMAVLSIFGGSVGIGASAYEFNAVSVGSVPGMTDEEVKGMNMVAELSLIFGEMLSTDESQWDRNISKLQELIINSIFLNPSKPIDWEGNYHKHENWRRVNSIITKTKSDDSVSFDKAVRMVEWFGKKVIAPTS